MTKAEFLAELKRLIAKYEGVSLPITKLSLNLAEDMFKFVDGIN